MTEEELVEVPEEDEDLDEDWDYEEEPYTGPMDLGVIKGFFHTGPPEEVPLRYGDTITTIRAKLRERGRNADGLACLLNGQLVQSEAEPYTEVPAGANIVFSGSVKGG